MYQSIPTLTILPGKFFERANFPSPGHKKVRPRPMGQKNRTENPPRSNYFQKSSKKPTKHETEIMKNHSTEMLICLEILNE